MKAFKVTGTFRMGRRRQDFVKEVASKDKDEATEFVLSDLGSKHKVKRYDIEIDDVKEVKVEEISDLVVVFKAGGMKE